MDDTYGIGTHRLPRLFVTLLLAASLIGGSEALALTPRGRDTAGVIERLNENTKTFQLRRSKDAPPMTLTWNSRTRFIEGAQFVDASKLRKGTPVSVIYHSPFFGNPFVTKVVLDGATAIQTRPVSKRMLSCCCLPNDGPNFHEIHD